VWPKYVKFYRLIRDPDLCASRADSRITVGFLPWWSHSFYQSRLVSELQARGIDVRGSELSLRSLLCLLLKRDCFDAMHIHWPHGMYVNRYWRFPFVLLHLWLYRVLKNNLVWTVHELDEFYETRYPILDRIMALFLVKACRQLIVHSDFSAEAIRGRYRRASKITVLRHPSYIGGYPNAIGREDARARLRVEKQALLYLFLGRIKPYKGVEWLIDSFKEIQDKDARLVVAGEPFDEETGRRVVAMSKTDSRIVADIRYLPDEMLQIYMNAADIVVCPYRKTHTSGSIQLALSFGRPVIAPAIASVPEYVDDRCGILFDPTEPKALQAAMIAAKSRSLEEMGKNARERVAKLSWSDFAASHVQAYEQLARHAPLS
jgi:beta-1,4-mannosyltransferase